METLKNLKACLKDRWSKLEYCDKRYETAPDLDSAMQWDKNIIRIKKEIFDLNRQIAEFNTGEYEYNEQTVLNMMDALQYIEQDAVKDAYDMIKHYPRISQQRADASEAFKRYLHI